MLTAFLCCPLHREIQLFAFQRLCRSGGELIGLRCVAALAAAEILIEGEQCIRLQFGEHAAQSLLDPVDLVIKGAAVEFQSLAAPLPVRAKQKMKPEDPVIAFGKNPPAYQAKIGDVFLILPAVDGFVFLSWDRLQGNLGNPPFFIRTLAEAIEAGAEDSAKDARTRGRRPLPYFPETQAVAEYARLLGKGECFRAGPLHNIGVFSPFYFGRLSFLSPPD
jgi:hypothetical protein